MKKIFPIQGMHCKSCEMLIESACKDIPEVLSAKASSSKGTLEVEAKHISRDLEKSLEDAIEELGYHVGDQKKVPLVSSDSTQRIVAVFTVIFVGLLLLIGRDQGWNMQHLMTGINSESLFFYPLLMGLVAGISTCMALVGGVIASVSAKWNEQHQNLSSRQRFLPQLYFQGGRILGFVVLGGFLGMIGNVFLFDGRVMGIASILVGVLMLVLGIDLTKLFPRIRMISTRLPFLNSSRPRGGALLAGILTFFLPCGFTLAMQLLAISTGSFVAGAAIMGAFALGTLPGLLGIGGLLARAKGQGGKLLFSIVGVLTVFFGGYTINQGLILLGNTSHSETPVSSEVIVKTMTYTVNGLQPQELVLEQGKRYQIEILPETTVQGCMSTITLPGLDSHIAMIEKGETIRFEFVAKKAGSYDFVCAMGLSHNATIVVK